MEVKELLKNLEETKIYKNWKEQHQDSFLSHFFSPIDKEGKCKQEWETGFFIPSNEKMSVFTKEGDSFNLKPEDDVFKQKTDHVEELKLENLKTDYQTALTKTKESIQENYSQVKLGDGFVIAQTFQGNTVWNFTFITISLQFINVRVNATTQTVLSHQALDAIHKE